MSKLMEEMDRLVIENGISPVVVAVAEACRIQAVRQDRTASGEEIVKYWQKLGNSLEKSLENLPVEHWKKRKGKYLEDYN